MENTTTNYSIQTPNLTPIQLDALPGEEVQAKRSRFGKVFSLGGNRFQAVTYAGPVHRWDAENSCWQELDAAFTETPEGDGLVSTGDQLQVHCAPVGQAPFITLTDAQGRSLAWSVEDAQPAAPVAEARPQSRMLSKAVQDLRERVLEKLRGTAVYSGLFPGVTLKCHAEQCFKDEFIFDSAAHVRPITFRFAAEGLTAVQAEDGSVVFQDAGQRSVFRLPAPYMVDADGTVGTVTAALTQQDGVYRLTCTPDAAFVAAAAYPLVLDPAVETAQTATAMTDTWVREGYTTNQSANEHLWATDNTSLGKRYSLLKVNTLPQIGSDHFLTKAYLCLKPAQAPTAETPLLAREVTEEWNPATVTFATLPECNALYQDYCLLPAGKIDLCRIDVTSLARKWYLGTNYGVLLTPRSATPNTVKLYSADSTDIKPYLVVNYASLAGLEGYLAYDQQSAGRAGIGYVGLANGNLIFAHSDTRMNGARMPVSVTHYYNACHADTDEFGLGNGWRSSLHHTLHKAYLNETVHYVYTDGDGTAHYFTGSGSTYTDLSGLSMTLKVGTSNVTITDKGHNVMTFPLISATPTASAPVTDKVLVSKLADACGNTVTVAATGLKISSVTDGSGRKTTFAYNSSGLLSGISTPWQQEAAFTYDSAGNPVTITYADGNKSKFTYVTPGSFALLQTATGPEGVKATYTYSNTNVASGLPYVITNAKVTGGSLTGSNTAFTYGNHMTLAKDLLTGKSLRYHFNDDGNMTSADDELGYAVYTRYDRTGDNANAPVNHATLRSRMQRVVNNYLRDSSFEENSPLWLKTANGTFSRDMSTSQWGTVSQKITTDGSNSSLVYQNVTLTPGCSYTLSGYLKSDAPKTRLRVRYTVDGTHTYLYSQPVAVGAGFQRVSVSFTLPENANPGMNCGIHATGTAGDAWGDCLQLEDGLTCNHYNLLTNSDFRYTTSGALLPDGWVKTSGSGDSWYGWEALSATDTPPDFLTGNALRIDGQYGEDNGAYQVVSISGSAGDCFTAGGWCSSFAKEDDPEGSVLCRIVVETSNGGTDWHTAGSVLWNHEEGNWQYASGPIVAKYDYEAVRFRVQMNRQMNHAHFNSLCLYREQFGTELTYDAKGNPTGAKATSGLRDASVYDAFNNLTSYTAPGRTAATTCSYGTTDAEKKKHLLLHSISPLGTKTANTYTSHGNPASATVSDNTGSTTAFLKTTTTWDAAGNYVTAQKDARGKTTTTVTDANRGTVTGVTQPNGQQISYTYDALRRPTKVSATVGSNEYRNEYTYDSAKGWLTGVKHNTAADKEVAYSFTYDALGRPKTVKVDDQTLSTNTYNTNGTLKKTAYGNGGSVAYTYDGFGRVTGVTVDGETSPRYTYAYNAAGQAAHMKDAALGRSEFTEYDLAGRPCRKTVLQGTAHHYSSELSYHTATGNLSKLQEYTTSGRYAYSTAFSYDAENRLTGLTYKHGTAASGSTGCAYDKLGRLASSYVELGNNTHTSSYSYGTGGQGTNSSSPLVKTLSVPGGSYTYAYSNMRNMTSVNDGTKTVSYQYDKLGQLTRANDPYDTTAGSAGTTWVYAYDLGGNLTSRKAYAYTTDTVGTAVQTIPYTYGDSNWKDKLTAYNGTAISYDAIGNPLTDGTWTYTWQRGRQLGQMSKTGETAAFTYNAEGIRVKKVCTTTGTTQYTLRGKDIVRIDNPDFKLHFFYDAQNRPAVVRYADALYGYVYNLQGDVVALIDSAGNRVVQYRYDAWGKPLSKTGSMANTLGTYNPFRYRHYVYDEETGVYYLRSRYYNPVWGRFLNADGQINSDLSLVALNLYAYCANNPVANVDNNGKDFRAVGAGVQLDGSVALGPAGVGIGIEAIVYWDEQITSGKGPTIAIYMYNAGSADMLLENYQREEIKRVVQEFMYELKAKASYLMQLPLPQLIAEMESLDYGLTASGFVVLGNERFTTPNSYEKDFDNTTVNLRNVKISHSFSESCHSIGVGYTFLGSPQGYGITWTHSYYSLLQIIQNQEK